MRFFNAKDASKYNVLKLLQNDGKPMKWKICFPKLKHLARIDADCRKFMNLKKVVMSWHRKKRVVYTTGGRNLRSAVNFTGWLCFRYSEAVQTQSSCSVFYSQVSTWPDSCYLCWWTVCTITSPTILSTSHVSNCQTATADFIQCKASPSGEPFFYKVNEPNHCIHEADYRYFIAWV